MTRAYVRPGTGRVTGYECPVCLADFFDEKEFASEFEALNVADMLQDQFMLEYARSRHSAGRYFTYKQVDYIRLDDLPHAGGLGRYEFATCHDDCGSPFLRSDARRYKNANAVWVCGRCSQTWSVDDYDEEDAARCAIDCCT